MVYVVYYSNEHAPQVYQRYTTKEEADKTVRYLRKHGNNAWVETEHHSLSGIA